MLPARFSGVALDVTQGVHAKMTQTRPRPRVAANASPRLVKIGSDLFPVYGNERCGWSVEPVDLTSRQPGCYRYGSLEEVFFALVNLNVAPEGKA